MARDQRVGCLSRIQLMSAPFCAPRYGSGKAHVHAFGPHAHFSELSYTYPLKLLSPDIPFAGDGAVPVGVAYMISYGGGLVSGDRSEVRCIGWHSGRY
jgi:hypothetical protein